jgi:hypothetical protein
MVSTSSGLVSVGGFDIDVAAGNYSILLDANSEGIHYKNPEKYLYDMVSQRLSQVGFLPRLQCLPHVYVFQSKLLVFSGLSAC